MRQAGIIAAGALHALDHHRGRLADDHANAKRLASGLSAIPGIQVNGEMIDTNMVYFDVEPRTAKQVAGQLKERDVLVLPTGEHTVRAVTSLAVDIEDILQAIEAVQDIMSAPPT
jgi:threonine aldolase